MDYFPCPVTHYIMKYAFHPQTAPAPSPDSDLARLLSILRERESALVILFEERSQHQWERAEWLLKECEYQEKESRLSREIRSLVLRWVLMGEGEERSAEERGGEKGKQARSFWVKAKMVMKMSLERMKLLNLLSYPLFEQYEAIIEAMNQGYDRAAGITHYRDIEEMIKNRNRTIHDLLNCATRPPPHSFRERYELSAKHAPKEFPSESKIKHPAHSSKPKDLLTLDSKPIRRPLSHQSHKNHLNSKDFLFSKKAKRVQKLISSYEENVGDLMAAKVDVCLDKKKSLQQNLESLYDGLMQRNIGNHKTISKFIFSHSGRVFKRLRSKKNLIRPTTKKLMDSETPKRAQKERKKGKFTLAYDRAASAKLKRKEIKQIHKFRQSQIFDGERGKHKKLLIR